MATTTTTTAAREWGIGAIWAGIKIQRIPRGDYNNDDDDDDDDDDDQGE